MQDVEVGLGEVARRGSLSEATLLASGRDGPR